MCSFRGEGPDDCVCVCERGREGHLKDAQRLLRGEEPGKAAVDGVVHGSNGDADGEGCSCSRGRGARVREEGSCLLHCRGRKLQRKHKEEVFVRRSRSGAMGGSEAMSTLSGGGHQEEPPLLGFSSSSP